MPPNTAKRLGYGGSAEIDGIQVLITGGNFDETFTTSFLQMVDTPPSGTGRTRVRHADGVNSYSGSLTFDVTAAAMSMFSVSRMLGRWYSFDVGINDGNVSEKLTGCKVTSLSLTGAPGGLVSASVSFMAKQAFSANSVANAFIRDDTTPSGQVAGYWWSGPGDLTMKLKTWTLTMNQESQSVYGNKNETEPLYIRVGLVDYLLDVEVYEEFLGVNDAVRICTKTFTLTGIPFTRGFSFNGVTDLGTFKYSFGTAATASDPQSDVDTISVT